MNAIIHLLIHPLFILWFSVAAAAVFYWHKKRKPAKYCLIFSLIWLFVITVSPVPEWMAGNLEKKYTPLLTPPQDLKGPVYIMVLGAGHTNDPDLPALDKLYPSAIARLTEGIRLNRLISGSKLVCSGYKGRSDISQAEASARVAVDLGVAGRDTLWLAEAHNTKAEAMAYLDRIGTSGTLILVTDAIHMPRAMKWFQHYGLHPIPAPTNHYIKKDPHHTSFPLKISTNKIILMEKSLHEYIGMLAR